MIYRFIYWFVSSDFIKQGIGKVQVRIVNSSTISPVWYYACLLA